MATAQPFAPFATALLYQARLFNGRAATVTFASKGGNDSSISFGDQLLDYIEGGPKLRKWYGVEDLRNEMEAEGNEEDNGDEIRDAVLVTDGDSDTGQLVVLSLVVKRCRTRLLVRDAKLATAAFGPYVEPVTGNVNDGRSLLKALKGVRAIICTGKLGALSDKRLLNGIEHLVYLSEVATLRMSGGLDFLLRAGARSRAMAREMEVVGLDIPCTILRPCSLKDCPGGVLGLEINKVGLSSDTQSDDRIERSISRQDAAMLCVKALDAPPPQTLILEVANNAIAGQTVDVEAVFTSLLQ